LEYINQQLTSANVKKLEEHLLPTCYMDFVKKARESDFIWSDELYKRTCKAIVVADDVVVQREDSNSAYYEVRDRAKNVRERGTSAWVTAYPLTHESTLIDEHYRISARRRLGLTPFDGSIMPSNCLKCGVSLENGASWHALDCTAITGTLGKHRHDDVAKSIVNACTNAGIRVDYEPRGMSTGTRKRVDIIAYVNPPVAIDVSIVNTSAWSYRNDTSNNTLQYACTEKEKKHASTTANIGGVFKGFILSTHGAYHEDARAVLGMIASAAVENGVAYSDSELINELKHNVSIKIQKGNAIIMLASLKKTNTSTNKKNNNNNKADSDQEVQIIEEGSSDSNRGRGRGRGRRGRGPGKGRGRGRGRGGNRSSSQPASRNATPSILRTRSMAHIHAS
jgi:hypothetical protein